MTIKKEGKKDQSGNLFWLDDLPWPILEPYVHRVAGGRTAKGSTAHARLFTTGIIAGR